MSISSNYVKPAPHQDHRKSQTPGQKSWQAGRKAQPDGRKSNCISKLITRKKQQPEKRKKILPRDKKQHAPKKGGAIQGVNEAETVLFWTQRVFFGL